MSSRVRAHVRGNIYGILALFLVLTGGTAMATHPGGTNTISSGDIIDTEVKEADIGQGAVGTSELKNDSILAGDVAPNTLTAGRIADGTLTGIDVANDSLTGADIAETTLSSTVLQRRVGASCPLGQAIRVVGQNGGVACQALTGSAPLGPAGGDLTGEYPNPAIASNAVTSAKVEDDSLTGDDVKESQLGQVPSAAIGGIGRWRGASSGTCNPGSEVYITCDFVSIDLPAPSRVFLSGAVNAFVTSSDDGHGRCLLATNLGDIANSTMPVMVGDTSLLNGAGELVPLTAITDVVGPGGVDFGIRCNETDGGSDIRYNQIQISAVALSPN